jgi:putative nucleotidyltransferase with HDIG domain
MMDQKFQNFFKEVLKVLASIVEERDVFFRGHGERVASIASSFAGSLALPQKSVEILYISGILHDVGMVYVPYEITNKPGELIEDELAIVRQHPVFAEKLLAPIVMLKDNLKIIRHHHERFNGNGYPDGLEGNQIPLEAQILALADCFDAMTASRPHRPALTIDEALEELSGNQDNRFNSLLVERFVPFMSSFTAKIAPQGEVNDLRHAIQDIIRSFRRGNIDLPVLPQIVDDLQHAVDDPKSTPEAISKILEKDAVITLRLLSVVNSPIYRVAEKILSIRQAIVRLGLKETQSIVLAIAYKNIYKTDDKNLMTLMEIMWFHAICCAYCSKGIAKKLGLPDIEKYFLMGLFHDIGKVLLLHAITKAKSFINSENWESEKANVIAALQEAHTSMGGAILERWGFNDSFIKVATQHENPIFPKNTDPTILVVHLANVMTRKIGYSFFNDNTIDLEDEHSAKLLNMPNDSLHEISEEISGVMKSSVGGF